MSRFERSAWLIGALCLASGLAVMAAQGEPQQPPSFRSGVDVVRLDVSVLDKNRRPVRGLTASDFTITVDGTPQPIVGFEAIVLPPPEPPTAAWMRDVAPDLKTNALGEPRLFVILMDDAQTPLDSYMVDNARTIARGIVDNLSPSDLAAVVFTKDNGAAQDFTSDRTRLLAAVDSFRSGWVPEMGILMRRYARETLRQAVSFLRHRPHGRNAIMLLSVGGGIVEEQDITARSDGAGITGGSGENPDPLARDTREAAYEDATGLSALAQDAALARIPIYGFSIAGLMADGQASVTGAPPGHKMPRFTERSGRAGNDVLRMLAAASGGRAIVDDNEPARAVPAIFDENSAYYVVGYRATYPLADGRSRRLKVRTNRPGATVFPSDRLLRSAKPATGKAIAAPPPLTRAIAELVPKSDLRLAVTAAAFALPRGRDAKAPTTGILATLRVTRPAPAERQTEQVQVLAKVFTPEGKEVGSIRQDAAVRLRPSNADAQFDVLTPLAMNPGRYNVRISAHSTSLDKTGSVYTDVTVPDFRKEKLSLSGVVVTAVPTFVAAPAEAFASAIPVVPTTRREFERGDRVSAFVRVYQGGTGAAAAVEVESTVIDARGVEVVAKTNGVDAGTFAAGRSADYTYELPLTRLSPGTYLLTIEARRGALTARRDVRFSVR